MAKAIKAVPEKKDSRLLRYLFYLAFLLVIALNIIVIYDYANGIISAQIFVEYSAVAFSFLFSSTVIAYLFWRGKTLREIMDGLGLSYSRLTAVAILAGLLLFFLIFLVEIMVSTISGISGVALPTNVSVVLGGASVAFLLFSALIAPINEEIFFRGFLVPRYGIFLPALLFAILHGGYASITEFVAAFVFGLLAGYVFKKTDSLYPSIIAHILVNVLAVTAFAVSGV